VGENRKCFRRCGGGPIARMHAVHIEGERRCQQDDDGRHVQYAEEFLVPWVGLDWMHIYTQPARERICLRYVM
jgi:hypothetical protein